MQLKKRARITRIDREVAALQACGLHQAAKAVLKRHPLPKDAIHYGECRTRGCEYNATAKFLLPTPSGIEIHAVCATCRRRYERQLNEQGRTYYREQKLAVFAARELGWPDYIIARD